ncbi:MAG: NAD(+) synthase [Muribaculaceae bacterium]|nr:NAD(+) synthase [Muribaculaceae bacterium]
MNNSGFFRAVAAAPAVHIADPAANAAAIIALLQEADAAVHPDIVVFPEMCVTGYTCGDLFHNETLLDGALKALRDIAAATASTGSVAIVGLPLRVGSALYNCAAAVGGGRLLCVVPKTYVPNYNEFYENRWWQPAPASMGTFESAAFGSVPFGTRQLLRCGDALVGIEICEDMWTPVSPGSLAALAGADVVVNLSASDDLTGKYAYLRSLVASRSASARCAYVYASAGYGESSTDLVFDAKTMIAENGTFLACNERWQHGPQWRAADIDLEAIRRDRMHFGSFAACARVNIGEPYATVESGCGPVLRDNPMEFRHVDPHPFVPSADSRLADHCDEVLNIQVAGLCRRLEATRCRSLVVGISGGLDSTLALLVAVRAFDRLGLPRTGILGVTMPGFGTTSRTHDNAVALMRSLGVSVREISIAAAVRQHFADIGQDPDNHDITYENSQARERTQILMDVANMEGGMVLGTGDLSELALGWATYNGDHMSMYGVNAGVPKTLVIHLVKYIAERSDDETIRRTLLDVVATPVSPELLPPLADGTIAQVTEDNVGPYELHDFFLYYMLRYGFRPSRVYAMARKAFAGSYDDATLLKWLRVFYRRFFGQQFKRSCLPDGPKVGSVCLSPRGDWRMPSDASAALWLREVDELTA